MQIEKMFMLITNGTNSLCKLIFGNVSLGSNLIVYVGFYLKRYQKSIPINHMCKVGTIDGVYFYFILN